MDSMEATKNTTGKPKGRILSVKRGYNPNSSSVGSEVPLFLSFALGSGAFSIIILTILNAADRHIRKAGKDEKKDTSGNRQADET